MTRFVWDASYAGRKARCQVKLYRCSKQLSVIFYRPRWMQRVLCVLSFWSFHESKNWKMHPCFNLKNMSATCQCNGEEMAALRWRIYVAYIAETGSYCISLVSSLRYMLYWIVQLVFVPCHSTASTRSFHLIGDTWRQNTFFFFFWEKSTLRQIPAPPTTLRKLKPFCQKTGCDVVDTLPWNLAFCAKQNFGQIMEGKLVGRRARARDDCQSCRTPPPNVKM
jgi:hypothetical protein